MNFWLLRKRSSLKPEDTNKNQTWYSPRSQSDIMFNCQTNDQMISQPFMEGVKASSIQEFKMLRKLAPISPVNSEFFQLTKQTSLPSAQKNSYPSSSQQVSIERPFSEVSCVRRTLYLKIQNDERAISNSTFQLIISLTFIDSVQNRRKARENYTERVLNTDFALKGEQIKKFETPLVVRDFDRWTDYILEFKVEVFKNKTHSSKRNVLTGHAQFNQNSAKQNAEFDFRQRNKLTVKKVKVLMSLDIKKKEPIFKPRITPFSHGNS